MNKVITAHNTIESITIEIISLLKLKLILLLVEYNLSFRNRNIFKINLDKMIQIESETTRYIRIYLITTSQYND